MDYNIAVDTEAADMGIVDMDFAVAVSVGKDFAVVEFVHMDSVDCYPDNIDSAVTGFAHCFDNCHLIHSRHNSSQNLRMFIIIIIIYEINRVNICKKIKKKDAYASLVFEI